MTMLFPPVLESRAVAIPFADSPNPEDNLYIIPFILPDTDGTIARGSTEQGIKHIQVVLKYKNSGESAVNPDYSPDNNTLFFSTYFVDYLEYDADSNIWELRIPYKVFKNRHPEKGVTYTAQIRFGANQLWISDPIDDSISNRFTGYGDWRARQVSTVPSGFGEWSNTQTVYCYGDANTSLTYSLQDFVPELVFTYAPEDNDPLEQCKINYEYRNINGRVNKTLVFNGVAQGDGSYYLRAKLPIAPVQVIYVSLEATTVNGTVRGRTINIPPLSSGSAGFIPEASHISYFEDKPLYGEEIEDGVIAKRIEIYEDYRGPGYSIMLYRTNVFTFDTIKLREEILTGKDYIEIKDFSVEMGEDYQYIAILKQFDSVGGFNLYQLAPLFTWGFNNSGYGRLTSLGSVFLLDKTHQLRIQGNVSVSSFKRNTVDQFQNTIGSKYPFYSRSANTDYRSFQLNGVVTINTDPTASFLKNDQLDGLRWEDDEGSRLVILNRDLYGDFEYSLSRVRFGDSKLTKKEILEYGLDDFPMLRGPSSIYDSHYARNNRTKIEPARTDGMVFMERKFRECVMSWLADGKPKLFRSETEGNMIVMPSGVSFSPLDNTGRIVYTVSMTLTEIALLSLENLMNYNLMPINIITHAQKNFLTELHFGDVISEKDYSALIEIEPKLEDNFERSPDGEGFIVKIETGLQEILDQINEFTFLRGNPQTPIYNEMMFIPDDKFNIGNISIADVALHGWESEHPFIEGIFPKDDPDVVPKFAFVSGFPHGMEINESTGKLSINSSATVTPQSPGKITFKATNTRDLTQEIYFTVSIGAVYNPLAVSAVPTSISAKTTKDEINIQIEAAGGVKFKDISRDPNDVDYIYTAENLPYGLSITADGRLTGHIISAQPGNDIVITVHDALGNSETVTIHYNEIYYWPYINQVSYFNLGYLEIGVPMGPIDLTNATVGGTGNNNFVFQVSGGSRADEIVPGVKISQDTATGHWIISGTPESPPDGWAIPNSVTLQLRDNGISTLTTEVHATATITLSQLLKTFTFEDNSASGVLSDIAGPAAMDGNIPIGQVLNPINIMNYNGGWASGKPSYFVDGGLPFYDANGAPYYKFRGTNFYPDYSVTNLGVISGRAVVGTPSSREAFLVAIDARGKEIPLTNIRGENTTIIHQITSKLELTEELDLKFGQIVEGTTSAESYKVEIPITAFAGGYAGDGYNISRQADWPAWLDVDIEGAGTGDPKFVIKQAKDGSGNWIPREVSKAATYRVIISDDTTDPEPQSLSIPFYVGEVVSTMRVDGTPTMAFAPPLQIGVYSTAKLSDPIVGGTPPYTVSTKGLERTDFNVYQDQGAEQDPNQFYIAGTPTQEYSEGITWEVIIKDGAGQELDYTFSSSGPVEALDFETLNMMDHLNLVQGYSVIPETQIIMGKEGTPETDTSKPAYNFEFNNKKTNIEIIDGVKFYGKPGDSYWYIAGTPIKVSLVLTSYQKEFRVIDGSGVGRVYNDSDDRHIWRAPLVYAPPLAISSVPQEIGPIIEGRECDSDRLFTGGTGLAKHPDVSYYYLADGIGDPSRESDWVLLNNGMTIKIPSHTSGGVTIPEVDTGLTWDESSTSLFSRSIRLFGEQTFTFRAKIVANSTNMLSEDYVNYAKIHFSGVQEVLRWQDYTSGDKFDSLSYEIPIQLAPSLVGYVFTIDLSDIPNVAKIVGGIGERNYLFEGMPPVNWSISGSLLTYVYSSSAHIPDLEGIDLKIRVQDSDPSGINSIHAILRWSGVVEPLILNPGSGYLPIAPYNLNSGRIRDMSGYEFDILVIGGSGVAENFRFELKNSDGFIAPYDDGHGNGLFTSGGFLKSPELRKEIDMGTTTYPARAGILYAWDNSIDPLGTMKISIPINIGEITNTSL